MGQCFSADNSRETLRLGEKVHLAYNVFLSSLQCLFKIFFAVIRIYCYVRDASRKHNVGLHLSIHYCQVLTKISIYQHILEFSIWVRHPSMQQVASCSE
jgi:hypothetical protein